MFNIIKKHPKLFTLLLICVIISIILNLLIVAAGLIIFGLIIIVLLSRRKKDDFKTTLKSNDELFDEAVVDVDFGIYVNKISNVINDYKFILKNINGTQKLQNDLNDLHISIPINLEISTDNIIFIEKTIKDLTKIKSKINNLTFESRKTIDKANNDFDIIKIIPEEFLKKIV